MGTDGRDKQANRKSPGAAVYTGSVCDRVEGSIAATIGCILPPVLCVFWDRAAWGIVVI